SWDDLVLPEDQIAQLHELCNRYNYRDKVLNEWGFAKKLSYGLGINALFSGGSGTGKTMAAEVIANALGLDLYRIDLSQVVNKYIGETEKNLDRVFTAAANANTILFFDEADALFGKRTEVKDAHDRYANLETSYLLQKMEQYDGIAILATNLSDNLDQAFTRRLAFNIHFPFPDEANRRLIWNTILSESLPVAESVDLETLVSQVKLSGGNIRNVAVAMAFLAADDKDMQVSQSHFVRALQREFQKLGKDFSIGSFLNKNGEV
ncbi:MAG: ATP-binding protein, partial [Streptococcus sp.]|nr:ATP-binding protein [Streptococcus sp.]